MAKKQTDDIKRTAYIPIHYPFTLDLSRDQRDPENAPAGHCRTLTNYITSNQIIKTRRGITEFSFI